MLVWELRFRHGRLRARFRAGKWQFLDRLPWYLGHHGKRSLLISRRGNIPWDRVESESTRLDPTRPNSTQLGILKYLPIYLFCIASNRRQS